MPAKESKPADDIEALFLKTIKSIATSQQEDHHKQVLINTAWNIKKIAESDDVSKTELTEEERRALKEALPTGSAADIVSVVIEQADHVDSGGEQ